MNASTLCSLIAQRIDPKQFQLWGLDVHWMSEEYDTPENRAIVDDVLKNYPELAAAYELSQIPIKRQAMYQAEADPLFTAHQAMQAAEHPDAEAKKQEWLAKREEIHKREIK